MGKNRGAGGGIARAVVGGSVAFGLLAGGSAARADEPAWRADWEIRAGIARHDGGVFSNREETAEVAFNGELAAPALDVLRFLGAPRPVLGTSLALGDGTDRLYAALEWALPLPAGFYVAGQLGGALHNGALTGAEAGEKELGCHGLFHLGAIGGYRVTDRVDVQLFADHVSNAGLCAENEGLESFGLRLAVGF